MDADGIDAFIYPGGLKEVSAVPCHSFSLFQAVSQAASVHGCHQPLRSPFPCMHPGCLAGQAML